MCLAIPARIIKIESNEADVDLAGIIRHISIYLTPDARVGDYVLIHTGYAISILNQNEAEKTLTLFQEIARAETQVE